MAKINTKQKTNPRSKVKLLEEIEELKERNDELEFELGDCCCNGGGDVDCDECGEKESQISDLEAQVEELEGRAKELEEKLDELDEQIIVLQDEQKEGMKDAMDEIAEIAGRFDG
ncbi:MAG: hypothetical protein V3U54_08625 [Thermodesulfobacteriota bacterium]